MQEAERDGFVAVPLPPWEGSRMRITDVRTHVLLDPGYDIGATGSEQVTLGVPKLHGQGVELTPDAVAEFSEASSRAMQEASR
jgi:hypothetical protein